MLISNDKLNFLKIEEHVLFAYSGPRFSLEKEFLGKYCISDRNLKIQFLVSLKIRKRVRSKSLNFQISLIMKEQKRSAWRIMNNFLIKNKKTDAFRK